MSKLEKIVYFVTYYGVQWMLSVSIIMLAWNYLAKDFFYAQSMEIKHAIGILIIKVILFNNQAEESGKMLEPPKKQNFFEN